MCPASCCCWRRRPVWHPACRQPLWTRNTWNAIFPILISLIICTRDHWRWKSGMTMTTTWSFGMCLFGIPIPGNMSCVMWIWNARWGRSWLWWAWTAAARLPLSSWCAACTIPRRERSCSTASTSKSMTMTSICLSSPWFFRISGCFPLLWDKMWQQAQSMMRRG